MLKKTAMAGIFFSFLTLGGCSDNGILFRSIDSYDSFTNAGIYMVGDPYEIDGVVYEPQENYDYFDSGDAFWFTHDDNHVLTANGERYDANRFTAMHRTLPLPSIVRVTNLNNKASVLVRVNDRGPMDTSRLIDVSKPVADYLNFSKTTVTPVQVEVMVAESKTLKNQLTMNNTPEKTISLPSLNQSQKGEVMINADSILYPGMKEKEVCSLKNPSDTNCISTFPIKDNPEEIVYSGATDLFYVQIGAFSKSESVYKIQQKLNDIKNLSVIDKDINNQILHIVRVGPFETKKEAQKILDKIQHSGYFDSTIIQE